MRSVQLAGEKLVVVVGRGYGRLSIQSPDVAARGVVRRVIFVVS